MCVSGKPELETTPWIYPIAVSNLHGATIPTSKSVLGLYIRAFGPESPDSEQVRLTRDTRSGREVLSDNCQISVNDRKYTFVSAISTGALVEITGRRTLYSAQGVPLTGSHNGSWK